MQRLDVRVWSVQCVVLFFLPHEAVVTMMKYCVFCV